VTARDRFERVGWAVDFEH